ncbi:alpha/beta fold hydrolase [Pusillimonas sp. DMV24BSW_D]|uniref:alpha/beta fold hydrolase n=1 Tax=Neopusillimonas aestuarii TaxID=2716226 RepID=UPI00140CABDA|nr:alpha/beta hydrolase [Pusillimonas sp. DMV24BSW_D]QIM48399.1 alpha/beta fold hydrolase [Pusillimonas sp. DMV24BSW_D]
MTITECTPRYGNETVAPNVSLHYQYFESQQAGPCTVLLHSLAMDHSFWRFVAPELAKHGSVLCVDLRGHGRSSKPQGPYTIAAMAADVRALLDRLSIDQVVVAGASMGGCVALQFAIDNADITRALGLIDTTAWYGENAAADWANRAAKARLEGFGSLVGFQQTRWFGEPFRERHPQVVQESVAVFVANDLTGYEGACHAMGAFDARSKLLGLRMPVSIVVGTEDYATPVAMAEALYQGIPGSRLKTIEGARHLTPLEVPKDITRMLSELRSRVQQ